MDGNKGVTRRAFALQVGVGLAAVSTVGISTASASAIDDVVNPSADNAVFQALLEKLYPVMRRDIVVDYSRKTATICKINKDGTRGDYFVVNSMGAVIVQLCMGKFLYEQIHKIVADIYGIDFASAGVQVNKFVEYLFIEGYLTFASSCYLSELDKKRFAAINVLNDKTSDKFVDIINQN